MEVTHLTKTKKFNLAKLICNNIYESIHICNALQAAGSPILAAQQFPLFYFTKTLSHKFAKFTTLNSHRVFP